MKKAFSISLILSLLTASLLFAASQADQQRQPSCSYCGMDRVMFAHSRMLIDYADGSSVGTCSLHCAAVEFAISIDKTPEKIQVGDYASHALIDAETAVWVLGGDQPGVMSKRAKWAFSDRAAAEKFVAEHGGSSVDFEAAMKAAYEDMYQDTQMIRNKRKMKKMPMNHQPKKGS